MGPLSYEVETPSGMFRRKRIDIIHLSTEDISPGRPVSHDSNSDETTSEDRSESGESGGGLLSPLTHSLQWSTLCSCVT